MCASWSDAVACCQGPFYPSAVTFQDMGVNRRCLVGIRQEEVTPSDRIPRYFRPKPQTIQAIAVSQHISWSFTAEREAVFCRWFILESVRRSGSPVCGTFYVEHVPNRRQQRVREERLRQKCGVGIVSVLWRIIKIIGHPKNSQVHALATHLPC